MSFDDDGCAVDVDGDEYGCAALVKCYVRACGGRDADGWYGVEAVDEECPVVDDGYRRS